MDEDGTTCWDRRIATAAAVRVQEIDREENARGNFKKDMVCMYWMRKRCQSGDRCRYLHVLDHNKMKVCEYFIEGAKCPAGDNCMFRHMILPHETIRAPRHDPLRVMGETAPSIYLGASSAAAVKK